MNAPVNACGSRFLSSGGIHNAPPASLSGHSLRPVPSAPESPAEGLQPVGRGSQPFEQGNIRKRGPAEGFRSNYRLPQRQAAIYVQKNQAQQSLCAVHISGAPKCAALASTGLPVGWQQSFDDVPITGDKLIA